MHRPIERERPTLLVFPPATSRRFYVLSVALFLFLAPCSIISRTFSSLAMPADGPDEPSMSCS